MADLIAIVYPEEGKAVEVLEKLKDLSVRHLISLEDAVYVTKNTEGKVKLHHSADLTGEGAVFGAFWGLLIGLIFFMPLGGMIIGAIAGAIGGRLADFGIDDNFARSLSKEMTPGSSAIFMLVQKVTADKVAPELAKYGGKIMYTSLSKKAEAKLQAMVEEAKESA
jgi:uncharacterized membrane protein